MNSYLIVEVSGKNIDHFLNRLFKTEINIYDLKYYENKIVIKISYDDYLLLKKIKTIYDVKIIGTLGKKRLYLLINKYKIFILFKIVSLMIIILLSRFIFFINVKGTDTKINEMILNEFRNHNITIFSFAKSYDSLKEINGKIKNKYKDIIEWMEIYTYGNSYNIDIVLKKDSNIDGENKPRDIIASENGYIKDMYVKSGNILKNKDDFVNKGDVIVSGAITRGDEVTGFTRSIGDIYAEVWLEVDISKPYIYEEEDNLGTYNHTIKLNIFNKEINLIKFTNKKQKSKTIYNGSFINIIDDSVINTKLNTKIYAKDDLLKKIEILAKERIEKDLKENEYIIMQKTLKKTYYSDKMNVEVFFKVYKNITSYRNTNTEIIKEGA